MSRFVHCVKRTRSLERVKELNEGNRRELRGNQTTESRSRGTQEDHGANIAVFIWVQMNSKTSPLYGPTRPLDFPFPNGLPNSSYRPDQRVELL